MSRNVYETVGVRGQPSLIRVLELDAGQRGDPLKGSLLSHCLDDEHRTPYTALSYTWGTQTAEDTTIQLQNGTQSVLVWANLKGALDTLRRPDKSVRLWIDALCIDQFDPSDKNIQLPLMGRVYAQAANTVIWLGPASENSALGMKAIQTIGDERRRLGEVPSKDWLDSAIPFPSWVAIRSLMGRQWWSRIWIVQEALKSRHSQVHCGGAIASMEDFVALEEVRYTYTRHSEGVRQLPPYPMSVILSDWSRNFGDASSDKCPMLEWLSVTERFAYTKPRDRFYALLGLTSPAARKAIEVQYDESKMSDAMLNVIVAIHCLVEYKILLPLLFPFNEKRTPGLPSWCPDWYSTEPQYQSLAFDGREGRLEFQACGPRHTYTVMDYHGEALTNKSAQACRLWLRGWPFDAIVFHDAFPVFNVSAETTPELQAGGREARRLALHKKCLAWKDTIEQRIASNQPNPYGSASGLRAAFWRTLIADRDQAWAGPPPEEFGEGLKLFLESGGEAVPGSMPYLVPAVSRLIKRCFVITTTGYLGLAPGNASKDDLICVLEGGHVPFTLRPVVAAQGEVGSSQDDGEAPRYKWVGETYVHGIMQGEWVAELEKTQGKHTERVSFSVG